MKSKRLLLYILVALVVALFPQDVDSASKKSRKSARTTQVAKKSKKSTKTSKTSKSSKSSRRSWTKYSKYSSRKSRKSGRSASRQTAVWRPFRDYETHAVPTISYITRDSVASLRRKSAAGNPEAQYLLGCSYFESKVPDTPADSSIVYAAEYWSQAARSGHAVGMGNYAYCLREGRGVRPDTLASVEWYVRSLVKGNSQLLRLVRQNVEHGSGMDAYIMYKAVTERPILADNGRKAGDYMAAALEAKFTPALLAVAGEAAETGDYETALSYYRTVIGPDDATIASILELLKQMGRHDETILKDLASTEFPEAQMALARLYIERNQPEEAARWLREAAQNGNDRALHEYVGRLVSGDGIARDYMQAYNWLEAMADEDDTIQVDSLAATVGVASFEPFVNGVTLLLAEDYAGALPYFVMSDNLDGDGAKSLSLLCQAKTDRKSKAEKELKELVKQNEPLAAYAWSILKPKEAVKTLQPAADNGSLAAMDRLGVILAQQKKYAEALHYLSMVEESGILTPDGALALEETVRQLSR